MFGAGAFFVARLLADPSLVGTAAGLAALLVSAALVYVVLSGAVVIVRVARRAWRAARGPPYYTADADTGGDADRRGT